MIKPRRQRKAGFLPRRPTSHNRPPRCNKVLSDGNKPDADKESLPRYYSQIIIVKNVELTFPTDMDAGLIGALSTTKNLTVSGLTFDTSVGLRHQTRWIALPGPYVLGGMVVDLPKTPNPEPERSWP